MDLGRSLLERWPLLLQAEWVAFTWEVCTVTTLSFLCSLVYIPPWFKDLCFIQSCVTPSLQNRTSYFCVYSPSIVPHATPMPLVVIGSTLGKSSASQPLLSDGQCLTQSLHPAFHLNAIPLSASSKMLFASAKNFLLLLEPSVLPLAPWWTGEDAAKRLLALMLGFFGVGKLTELPLWSHITSQVLSNTPGTPSDYLSFPLQLYPAEPLIVLSTSIYWILPLFWPTMTKYVF